jgi:hypothetical protein
VHDAERSVDDATVGVEPERDREVVILGVAVEPEAVVVIGMAAARVRDRQRCLMHGVVVERCQHLFSSVLAYQHCRLQLKVQARVKGLASCRPRTYGKQYQTNSV